MAFLYFLVEWSFNHGKRPSKVYEEYLESPKDFQLLQAFRNYKIEKENKAFEKANKKPLGGKKPF